jgi:DTW domain-containing protein
VKQLNQFQLLYKARKADSTRPFNARGSIIKRCERCLLGQRVCLCQWLIDSQSNDVSFCVIMHRQEILKPTNTGRLIAEVYPNHSYYFEWSRTQPNPALLELLDEHKYLPILIFPEAYVFEHQVRTIEQVHGQVQNEDRQPLFVILDGTWAQCKKMFKNSSYLQSLISMPIQPSHPSEFNLRKAPEDSHLCTVEVAIELLKTTLARGQYEHLYHTYQIFNQHYIASRKTAEIDTNTDSHQYLNRKISAFQSVFNLSDYGCQVESRRLLEKKGLLEKSGLAEKSRPLKENSSVKNSHQAKNKRTPLK